MPLSILAVSCVFSYLNAALGFASVARNRHHKMIVVSLVGLAVNVITNIIVIPIYGINGAATAYLFSELVTLCGVYLVFRRDVGLRIPLVKDSGATGRRRDAVYPVVRCGPVISSRGWWSSPEFCRRCRGHVVSSPFSHLLGGIPDELHGKWS